MKRKIIAIGLLLPLAFSFVKVIFFPTVRTSIYMNTAWKQVYMIIGVVSLFFTVYAAVLLLKKTDK